MPSTEDLREAVLIEAGEWVGTPYRHQHRAKGLAVDCIGLIWGVGEAAGVLDVDMGKAQQFLGYTRLPNPRRMLEALETFFVAAPADVQPGDFAWLAWDAARNLPQHLAILGQWRDQPTLIHADSVQGKVVQHGFTMEWPGLVKSWWRFPGLAE